MPVHRPDKSPNLPHGAQARLQAFVAQRARSATPLSAGDGVSAAATTAAASQAASGQQLAELRRRQQAAFHEELAADAAPGDGPALSFSLASLRPPENRWLPIGPSAVVEGQSDTLPVTSGRATGLAITADGQRIYAATANGGVWRSEDEGYSWISLMDAFDVDPTTTKSDSQSCGAIAIVSGATADEDRIYIGSGEAHGSDDAYYGVGPVISFDGGRNWLTEETVGGVALVGQGFFALAVNPTNPDDVLAGTQSGLFRRQVGPDGNDAGHWHVVGDLGSVSSVVFDSDGQNGYAACRYGSVFRLNGEQLTPLEPGWPDPSNVNMIALAMQLGNSDILYALVSDSSSHLNGLYRIDLSAAENAIWQRIEGVPYTLFGADLSSQGQGWYDIALAVSPLDVNRVVVGGAGAISVEEDGQMVQLSDWSGSLYDCQIDPQNGWATSTFIGRSVHSDIHALTYAPAGDHKLWVGCDGGVFVSHEGAATLRNSFRSCNNGLATLSMNHFAQHPTNPDIIFCGTQDNGGLRYTGEAAWRLSSGGDSGYFVINWADPNRVLDTYTYASIRRSLYGGGRYQYDWFNIDLQDSSASFYAPMGGTPYNPAQPHEAERVAFGGSRLWLSDNFGETWRSLPNNDQDDSLGGMAESVRFASYDKLYVGLDWGNIIKFVWEEGNWRKIDLETYQNGLPSGLQVTDIAIDPADPSGDAFFVTLGGQFWGDGEPPPRVWHYNGQRWRSLGGRSASARQRLLNSVHHAAIVVDPENLGHLYVGTDIGVWRTLDRGRTWATFSEGLPDSAIMDLQLHESSRLLRLSTHGRGLYELSLDEAQSGIELYIRQQRIPYPDFHGGDYPPLTNPDIKVTSPFEASLLADGVPFANFAQLYESNWAGVNPDYEVRNKVYVQIHNRGINNADDVRVMLLMAKLDGGALPPLPRGYEASLRNGSEINNAGWRTIGHRQVDGVRAGRPAVLSFTLSSNLLPAIRPDEFVEEVHYSLVALIHHEDDPFVAPSTTTVISDGQRKVGVLPLQYFSFPTEALPKPRQPYESRAFASMFKAEHEIATGETLAQIAEKFYTAGDMAEAILEANRDILEDEGQVLPVGKTLRIPASLKHLLQGSSVQKRPPAPFMTEHRVVKGNTLSGIARKYYGSGIRSKWHPIYQANRELIGPNPGLLPVGILLKIPRLDS